MEKKKINKILYYITTFIIIFIFCLEFCCHRIFSFYFDWSLLGATDQVFAFTEDMFVLIMANLLAIMIFFLPFILLISYNSKIVFPKTSLKRSIGELGICVLLFFIFLFTLNVAKEEENSRYRLYYEIGNIELSLQKFGVVHGFLIDLKRNIVGFTEKVIIDEDPSAGLQEPDDPNKEPDKEYDYNNLELDFTALIEATNDETLKQMHEYFSNETGSRKNEYTGFFAGKNLILFMAESFNEIAVDEKRTPTLYKLVNNGFVMKNFYTPTISSTIGGEFQELTGLVAASGFLSPWKSGENSFPFGIANLFKEKEYRTFAYHNHNYTFQSRHKYLKALGFDNFTGCRNGLEEKINCNQWPESDLEMIDKTTDDYLNSSEPFFTYYVTVSGHGDYGWDKTAIGRKNKESVSGLPYSEKVLSYLAANVELDKALELLLSRLEEKGVLNDTVIALVGDHYPYYLTTDEVNEVSSYKKDGVVEINHSNFILWNNQMDNVEVSKVGSQIDVLPTIYNLFGIEYDSRLIIGKDILSDTPGLAIFGNHSWVSDYGTYFASSGNFVAKDNIEVDPDYVRKMNRYVGNKMNMSKLIMTKDYYQYIQK